MRAGVSKDSLALQPRESPKGSLQADLESLIVRFKDVPIPLVRSALPPDLTGPLAVFAKQSPRLLFPGARCPEGALAGLLLLAGHWNSAHELVDDLETPDGCYWHALVHRIEPDTGNSDYWFRQTGSHPLFPAVLKTARRLAAAHLDGHLRLDSEWNPEVFNGWCEQARRTPKLPRSAAIASIHSAECHLLWSYSLEKACD